MPSGRAAGVTLPDGGKKSFDQSVSVQDVGVSIDIGLFNGDVGIVWPDETGELATWFAMPDGVRAWPLSALPAHETGFAMTIHKSQGSEFDEVAVVLPQSNARVLGRELLYTALTRGRRRVQLLADDAVLRHAIEHSTHRFSGLADRLAR